jgi:transposase
VTAGDKICILLEGLRGEESISTLCRCDGIAESLYYRRSKELLKAGKRLAGEAARAATTNAIKALRREKSLSEVVAKRALEACGGTGYFCAKTGRMHFRVA